MTATCTYTGVKGNHPVFPSAGLRREPDLPDHVAVTPETTKAPAREFEMMLDDSPEDAVRQRHALGRQMAQVARQASLDRNDGIPL